MTVFQNVRKGLIPARLTVADVVALQDCGVVSEDERFELIEGEIVPMAAMKSAPHEDLKRRLARALIVTLPSDLGVFVETSIAFEERTYLEPDIAVFPGDLSTWDARGADMLLVVEVSTSSIAFDTTLKAGLYARFGVREYWVVDAVRRTIRVHRAPGPGGYADVEEYEAHDAVPALLLPDVTIRLDALA